VVTALVSNAKDQLRGIFRHFAVMIVSPFGGGGVFVVFLNATPP
jgi:hypothetical protein